MRCTFARSANRRTIASHLSASSGLLLVGLATVFAGRPAFAGGTELIVNGSFDEVAYSANTFNWVTANAAMAGMAPVSGTNQTLLTPVIPGWATTVVTPTGNTPMIEIWNGNFGVPNSAPGPQAGIQYAEMNSTAPGTLLQPITNLAPGSQLYLSFWHSDRGGDTVPSQMRVTLWDLGANGTFDSILATPTNTNAVLGGDDQFLVDALIGPETFNSNASPLASNWKFHEYATTALTNHNMVLTFQSVTSGTLGNFLDTVSLNTVSAAPEPGTLALLALGGLVGIAQWRKRTPSADA